MTELEPAQPLFADDDPFFPSTRPADAPASPYGSISWKTDREAARMVAVGHSLEDIAARFQLGDDLRRAEAAVRRGMHVASRTTVDEARLMELDSLVEMERVLWAELRDRKVLVQQGRVIIGPDGDPVEDSRFTLEVMDRILKIKERRSKYLGLDAVTRISVEADQIGAEITQMIALINSVQTDGVTVVGELVAGEPS